MSSQGVRVEIRNKGEVEKELFPSRQASSKISGAAITLGRGFCRCHVLSHEAYTKYINSVINIVLKIINSL